MATLLWGKVYCHSTFAGILCEEAGNDFSFEYDEHYLRSGNPSIAYTLPLESKRHMHHQGLHPFFDNLVAEGWLEQAQTRLLGKRQVSRFELLLAFGHDCAGAVSVIDPEPETFSKLLLDLDDPREMAVLKSRASLSGVQPKLALVAHQGKYSPAKMREVSTHIGKFPSEEHDDIILNEYLTTQAFKALLPDDEVVDVAITDVQGFDQPALVITRFDRSPKGKIHFEEFNSLLGKKSSDKYEGAHPDMSRFIQDTQSLYALENYRLFSRIFAGLLLGNTDMHLKNFAMFHTYEGLKLTPSYDQVAAALYGYKTVALKFEKGNYMQIDRLKSRHLFKLAQAFGLSKEMFFMIAEKLKNNKEAAFEAIASSEHGAKSLKNKLIKLVDARCNSIG